MKMTLKCKLEIFLLLKLFVLMDPFISEGFLYLFKRKYKSILLFLKNQISVRIIEAWEFEIPHIKICMGGGDGR